MIVWLVIIVTTNIRNKKKDGDDLLLESPRQNLVEFDAEKIIKDLHYLIDNEVNKAYDLAIMKRISSEMNSNNTRVNGSYRLIMSENDKNIVLRDTYERIEVMLSDSFYDRLSLIFKDDESVNTYILEELNYKLTVRIMQMNEKI